jgi:hypothetical protein
MLTTSPIKANTTDQKMTAIFLCNREMVKKGHQRPRTAEIDHLVENAPPGRQAAVRYEALRSLRGGRNVRNGHKDYLQINAVLAKRPASAL